MSGGTVVAIKQEAAVVDTLVTGFVDSTTFVSSPALQAQPAPSRQQGGSQTGAGQRQADDCEPVTLPSKGA